MLRTKMEWLFLLSIWLILAGCVSPNFNFSGLKNIANLGVNDKLKQQAVDQETKNFNKLRKLIKSSNSEKVILKKLAAKQFGKPIISFPYQEGEAWVYKAGYTQWIGSEKIYLFFDKNESLIDWKYCAALKQK